MVFSKVTLQNYLPVCSCINSKVQIDNTDKQTLCTGHFSFLRSLVDNEAHTGPHSSGLPFFDVLDTPPRKL